MKLRRWFLLPARATQLLFFAVPLAIIIVLSLLTRGDYGGAEQPWNTESYRRLLDPLYVAILWRSVWMAAAATVLCLLLGFPLALYISRAQKNRGLLLQLVILPFWTSFLIRTYAWLFLLRDTGLINTALLRIGAIHQPLPLLYNNGAVLLGLVYGYLPFMVLPVYAALERLDPSLSEAAADLGASPLAIVTRVIAPLAAPGILAGSMLVFIPSLGAYLTPDLMGGGRTVMIGNLVQNQFTTARDWPFGSALSLTLMILTALVLILFLRRAPQGVL